MKNKMMNLLGTSFSTNEKVVSQSDKKALRSTAEMLVIEFDQEKFEQFLSTGTTRPFCVCKHKKISVARSPLDNS